MRFFAKISVWFCALYITSVIIGTTSCAAGWLRHRGQSDSANSSAGQSDGANSSCDSGVPAITAGYGADGSYAADITTLSNPLWGRQPISVFLPRGANGKRPVIFFSHAFGANVWTRGYTDLMHHMVSRGYIVIYSPYPTIGASVDERYAILWKGFEVAVQSMGDRMDLSRVGFMGHSFGGGATPAMAYKGLVERGWGQRGAFMYLLAPWYSYQITPEQLRQFPDHVVQLIQVYDKDDTNDHRMAIDIYRNTRLRNDNRYFLVVRSDSINGCTLTADHGTPGRNPSLRLKQYAVFRPFDAITDYVFNGNPKGREVISGSGPAMSGGYQPLHVESQPEPQNPETNYQFPWSSDKNLRRSLERW